MSDDVDFQDMIRAARANKEYLSYIDFEPNSRHTLTIERVIRKRDVVGIGAIKHKVVDLVKFRGTEKMLWLSLGKLKKLGEVLGRDASKWPGKKIKLWADPSVKMRGQVVGGIVIERAE